MKGLATYTTVWQKSNIMQRKLLLARLRKWHRSGANGLTQAGLLATGSGSGCVDDLVMGEEEELQAMEALMREVEASASGGSLSIVPELTQFWAVVGKDLDIRKKFTAQEIYAMQRAHRGEVHDTMFVAGSLQPSSATMDLLVRMFPGSGKGELFIHALACMFGMLGLVRQMYLSQNSGGLFSDMMPSGPVRSPPLHFTQSAPLQVW